MTSSDENPLNQIIPACLDDIIKNNRDLAKLRLATAKEGKSLQIPQKEFIAVIEGKTPKKELYNWYPVCLEIKGVPQIFILSYIKGEEGTWNTSPVIYAADDWRSVFTKSGSYYALSEPGKGEPPTDMRLVLCHVLWAWGLGSVLGVPFVICD